MKYQDSRLKQMLAAEYVLGTLTGRARRRFARLLRERHDLRKEVHYWENRLASLHTNITPQTPRAVVWADIDRRINASTVGALPAAAPAAARPEGYVAFWRGWALVATAASVVMAFALFRQSNLPPPAPQIVRVEVPVLQPMPYVAMLQPSASEAKWLVTVSPERRLIRVAAVGAYPIDVKRESLELWVLGDDGTPHSLGILPNEGEGQMEMPGDMTIPSKPTLAVSREPIGGSPTGLPTGPVILAAPAMRSL